MVFGFDIQGEPSGVRAFAGSKENKYLQRDQNTRCTVQGQPQQGLLRVPGEKSNIHMGSLEFSLLSCFGATIDALRRLDKSNKETSVLLEF
jgi:hypothetical protein